MRGEGLFPHWALGLFWGDTGESFSHFFFLTFFGIRMTFFIEFGIETIMEEAGADYLFRGFR